MESGDRREKSDIPKVVASRYLWGVVALLVGVVALIFFAGLRLMRASAVSEIQTRLMAQVETRTRIVQDREIHLRRDALFLASTPPVSGIIRAEQDGGLDRRERSSTALWKRRLETIFLAYARTDPQIIKLCLVGVADSGREIVRVDRRDGQLHVVGGVSLERKTGQEFFVRTASRKAGEVYLSDLDFERSDGRVLDSNTLIQRVGTPLYDQRGRLFGMLVINADARPMLDDFRRTLIEPFRAFLTNDSGNFLSNPRKRLASEFALGAPHRWWDEFDRPGLRHFASSGVHWIRSPHGSLMVAIARIPLDTFASDHHWMVACTYPDSALDVRVAQSRNMASAVALGILLVGGLLLFLYHRLQARVRRRILALNADLERQVRERTAELEASTDQLRQRTEEAMAANRAKTEFLANMSHEIRTPLSAVLGMAYILEKRVSDPDSRELVVKIRRAGNSLQRLIDDVLDFSKIEVGRLDLENAPFVLNDVLDNISAIMGAGAGDKDLELVIDAPIAGTARLVGDAHRLEQVLINLTGNAIKFTERGSVRLRIGVDDRSADRVRLRFSVIDTGIGISEEKQKGLFSAFTQADTSTTRRFGGSGLGLAISRLLVEKMDGKIEIRSEEGRGSEFRFTALFGIGDPLDAGEDSLAHLDVLVVDDNELARDAISSVAGSMGWNATAVDSGEEAIRLTLARSEGPQAFDVLLLDWKMPGLDGLETMVRLRERMRSKVPPIVLLATAHSRQDLADHPECANLDGILSKPVTGASLYDAVFQARQRRGGVRRKEPEPREKRLVGIRALVVDDNETNRELLETIFVEEGADVHLAKDGAQAVLWLQDHARDVDIVLMDIQMPVMDGYAAARAIRLDPRLAGIPIIALSAGVLQEEREAAIRSGMDDFVSKPYLVKTLLETILRLVGRTVEMESSVPPGAFAGDEPPEIGLAKGIELWMTEKAYFARLMKFRSEQSGEVDSIAALLGEGDFSRASFALHRLKGVAGILQMGPLGEEILRTERAIRDGEDTLPILPSLGLAMDRTLAAISKVVSPQPSDG